MEGKTIICAVRKTEDQRNEETLTWLREGKREIEVLIFATKDQEVQTNFIKGKIDKSQTDSKCRMCKEKDVCACFIHFSLVVTFPGNLNSNGNVIT